MDRAALDAALACGLEQGGWCPLGRRAEDGRVPAHYRLVETESPEYAVRTERNVLDSDATLILYRGGLIGGTRLTRRLAARNGKPCLAVDLAGDADPAAVRNWLIECGAAVLNVAGPRESQSPGIGAEAREFLAAVLGGRR